MPVVHCQSEALIPARRAVLAAAGARHRVAGLFAPGVLTPGVPATTARLPAGAAL